MRVLTVTDAWHPQVNGVVRTIEATNQELVAAGHSFALITPLQFRTISCPGYREIRLSLLAGRKVARLIDIERDRAAADGTSLAIHIATEGPLGFAARRYCQRHGLPFTTAYHTRFPQYLRAMFRVPESWTYAFLRWFHRPATRLLTPTAEVERELSAQRLGRLARWTRGVDLTVFRPEPAESALLTGLTRPIFLYVGRVSVEKNIDAFLRLDLPGTKVVAGIGPSLELLQRRYPEVRFVGVLARDALARLYASADVFVFASRTDTFGLVLLEALACGTPVAAYPVQGPRDVVGDSAVAVLDDDLRKAALHALRIERSRCRAFAEQFGWAVATEQFISLQTPLPPLAAQVVPALKPAA